MPTPPRPPDTPVTVSDGTRRYTVALSALPRRLRRAIARTPAPQLRRRVLRWGATAVVVLGIATATAAQSQGTLPATFNLANLSSTSTPAGSVLDGGVADDRAGGTVADAGDVNGDGFADVIIGASGADPGGRDGAGAAYVVFGSATGIPPIANLNTDLDGANGFVLQGAVDGDGVATSGSYAGNGVSGAGDVNGDGFDDVIVGAPFANGYAGEAYVVFGKADWRSDARINLANADITLQGAEDDSVGVAVSGAGDLNGDGIDDIIIGGSCEVVIAYVVFGSRTPKAVVDLDRDADIKLFGTFESGNGRMGLSAAGDVNGDGIDDVLLGDAGTDTNGAQSGAVYVVFGNRTPPATIALGSLGAAGITLLGPDSYGASAGATVGGGDVNGDAFADVIVGTNNGVAYVVLGSSTPATTRYLGIDADIVLQGTEYEAVGRAVSGVGDVNGDGFADMIIGAHRADPGGRTFAGVAYVVFGSNTPTSPLVLNTTTLDGSNGFVLQGAAAVDFAGGAVSEAGDVNGDGFADMIIGAPQAPNGPQSGTVYVVHGQASTPTTTPVLTLNFTIGRAGSAFVVRGTGYPANTLQRVRVNGTTVGTIAIGTDGQWALVLQTSPQQAAGRYRVTLEAVAPRTQSTAPLATFTVDPAAPLRATPDGSTAPTVVVPTSIGAAQVVYLPAVVDAP